MRAMRVRIAAGILGTFAAGVLIFEPVETSARGSGFAGGRTMRAAIIRPAIVPPHPVVAPLRARAAPFAHIRLRRAPAVWIGDPWDMDYDDSPFVSPDEQYLPNTTPSPDADVIPRRLGCSKQFDRVCAEEAGNRTVAVVRC